MISYGSHITIAEMLCGKRSHQLGEGQLSTTGMSGVVHPPLLVYGSQGSNAEMPMRYRSQGEGQTMHAEMPMPNCPSRLVYGSQSHGTAMSHLVRSHQLGKGQQNHAAVSLLNHPSRPVRGGTPVDRSNARRGPSSPPVYGSLCYHAAMPIYDRSHFFTRGQRKNAAMPSDSRLSREGTPIPRRNAKQCSPFPNFNQRSNIIRRNAKDHTPLKGRVSKTSQKCQGCNTLPTSFGPYDNRRNVIQQTPNFNQRPIEQRRNAL